MKRSSFITVCLLFLLFISVWIALMIAPKHFLHRFESSLYKTAAWAQQMESKFKDQDFYILKTDKKPLLICICQVCLMLQYYFGKVCKFFLTPVDKFKIKIIIVLALKRVEC